MKRMKVPLLLGALVVFVLAVGTMIATHGYFRASRTQTQALYYCPMHPTYTNHRPGSCPICNMTLVKREGPSAPSPRPLKDICYLHNCPMMKEGKVCPMLVVAKAGEKVNCPICGTHVAQPSTQPTSPKILYWTDPMLPGYKSDKPGKSPMGMELVPVYEAEDAASSRSQGASPAGYASVLISPQKRQLIGVKTASVQMREMTKTIRTVGRIAYDPELYQAQEEYLQALKALSRAQDGSIPEVVEQAKRLAESSRTHLRLLGLSAGLIDEIASRGAPDQRLLLSDAGNEVWLYAPIYEFEIPFLKIGQAVTAEIPTMPGKALEGTVQSIDPVLDPTTRSVRIRALLPNPEGVLKPEMYVNASIRIAPGTVLAVPEEAVFNTGAKQIIFVDKGEGFFEPRDVAVGVKADGYYEVKQGLAEGETVVTSGNFLIDSESRLKGALEGMSDGGHPHGP